MIPIPARALGAEIPARIVEIDARRVMAFAAGIGADSAMYFDNARPKGIVAPPTFVVALEWPVMLSAEYLSAVGRDVGRAFEQLVHGFQISLFHSPIAPGDRLSVSGRIVEVKDTQAGALVTTHITTVDAERRTPVADGWFGALYRATRVDGPSGCIASGPALRSELAVPAADTQRIAIAIPRCQAHIYTECAQIWNPIHTERAFALSEGLPDIILHGTCTWAMALERIASQYRSDSTRPLRRAAARFTRMVVPGTYLQLEHTSPDTHGIVNFAVRDGVGAIVLGHATAELA